MLGYFVKFATGTFSGLENTAIDEVFNAMLANPGELTMWMGLTVIVRFMLLFSLLVKFDKAARPAPESRQR